MNGGEERSKLPWYIRWKPGVPKTVLLWVASLIWGFAAFKVLYKGITHTLHYPSKLAIMIPSALVVFFLMYRFLFLRITRRHICRIRAIIIPRPCVFSFFDLRSYIFMGIMITIGILVTRFELIPDILISTFYIGLGMALLVSAGYYVYESFDFEIRDKSGE